MEINGKRSKTDADIARIKKLAKTDETKRRDECSFCCLINKLSQKQSAQNIN